MKKWVGMWTCLLSFALLLSLFSVSAQAYDVSGFVNYSGSKTGRVYLKLQGNGQFGTSIASVSAAAPVPFTIRGVQPGNYMLSAFMDVQGTGSRHTTDPSVVYMTEVITVTTANFALSSSVNLADPATVLQPAAPAGFAVLPADNAALVMWGGGGPMAGEDAESYDLYWGTNPDPGPAASTGSILSIPATGENTVILTSLNQATIANGSQLYFSLFAKIAGQSPSVPSTTLLTTIGNPDTAGAAVSGTVNYTGAASPGVPLLIALVNAVNDRPTKFYAGAVLSPNPGTNPFSIANVPDGTYELHAILDLNNNGLMDTGDLSSGNSRNMVTVSGGTVTGQTAVTVNDVNAEASIRTNHGIDGNYNLNIEISGMKKRPLSVTLDSGPNVAGPIDMPLDESWGGFYSWLSIGANVPQVNDLYSFTITYSDNSTETITGKVTGVLNSFATPLSPTGNITYNATPTFNWSAPGSAPSGDWSYSIYLNNQNGGGSWDSKQIPNNMSSELFANLFPGQPNLPDNSTYSWSINVSDINGNSASNWTNFSFGSTLAITTSILPQGDVSTFYSQNLAATGGVPPYNWYQVGGALPPGLSLSGSMISGTPSATGNYSFTVQLQDYNFTTVTQTFSIDVIASAQTAFVFTGAVQDCTTSTCVILSGATITTIGLTPEITTTSDAIGVFSISVPVTTVNANSLPATAPFQLIISSPSFVNTASSLIQLAASVDSSSRPYSLFPPSKLVDLGNTPGTGLILSRVVDAANPVTGYITGAVVTATNTTTGQPLTVEYINPATGAVEATGSTGSNGQYVVRNIPAGTSVDVTATAPGYMNFQPRTFIIYADTVSQGRISGTFVGDVTFTGGVQDCTTSTCTNIQGVNVTTVGLSPELTATSDVNGLFNLNVPPSASFHLILSKAGFNNTATSQMQFTSSYNASDRPYAMFSSANLSAWSITAGTGVIRSRIVDAVNPVTGYISGATVTASTATGPLLVEYVDPSGVISSIGPTGTNGMYIIRNIQAGAQVTVNATAPNYTNFQVKQFTVYADTVSQGRTTATLVTAGDTIPPTVPSGLTATPMGPNQINVAWSASTDNVGVDSYQVFRNGVFFSETFGVVSFVDYAVSPYINYSYSVIACDVANNCSTQSSPVSAMTTSGVPTGPTNITGTISYNGSKTGRVYVFIQTDNGTLGTSVPWPAGTTSANYTIQGVPSNSLSNNLNAFMDIANNGVRSASSPAAVLADSSSIKNITLTDTTEVAPAAPALVEVKPGPASVFIMWQGNEDMNGVVDADSYDVFWGPSALFNSNVGSKLNIAPGMDSPLVIDGLTDGTAYYFQVVAKRGIYEAKSAIIGPITVGATPGLNTVSGTVTYNGTIPANTPLYVAVVVASNNKGMGSLYYTKIASASASQAFSVSGIPDGSYNVYTILDLNKDSMFATGDATNTNGEQAPMITLSGNAGKSGVIIPLTSKNADVEVTTDHGKDVSGTSSWYSVNGRVSGQYKRPVTVTLIGKPASSTLTIPMDLGVSKNNNNEFEFWGGGGTTPPVVGDMYTFSITYSDGTSETVTGAVTGVSNNFPTNPYVTSSTIPQFSWSAPSPLPAGSYQYSLWVNGINYNKMWEAWSIPSSQLQIVYGSGSDSSAAPLQTSTQYNWSISSRDQNGNRATVQGLNFTTPAVAATPDSIAPYIVTTAPANGATGLSTNTQISVTFSELVSGMPSIETSLKNNTTGQYVVGNGSGTPDGLTYTFTPSALLTPGTTYSVQLFTVTDLAGNALPPTTFTFTTAGAVVTDTTKPVTTASPAGGTFASTQSVTLTANEAATIYYTTNGAIPTTSSSVYSSPIAINSTTTLKYFARDTAGNSETVKTAIYTITIPDTTAPVTTVSLAGGIYSTAQSVTLTANESAKIYYTTDGTTPTTASSVYSTPIAITATTTLKYFARDTAGNSEAVGSVTYTFLPSGDINADDKVDISDAHRLLEIAVGRVQATAADLKKADVAPLVNGMPSPDGVIGVGDVVVLLRRIVGSVTW